MADSDGRLTGGGLNLKTVNLAQLIQIFRVLPSFPPPSLAAEFRGVHITSTIDGHPIKIPQMVL